MEGLLATMLVQKGSQKLPPGAKWYMQHPDSRWLRLWDGLMSALAAWYFFEIPFSIAFKVKERAGAQPVSSKQSQHLSLRVASWLQRASFVPG